MEREFVYTKDRLRFIIESLLARDVSLPHRLADAGAEEDELVQTFEKRAALEFLLWFVDEAFPDNFSFRCRFTDLERHWGPELARRLAEAESWSPEPPPDLIRPGNVVRVDFAARRRSDDPPAGDD